MQKASNPIFFFKKYFKNQRIIITATLIQPAILYLMNLLICYNLAELRVSKPKSSFENLLLTDYVLISYLHLLRETSSLQRSESTFLLTAFSLSSLSFSLLSSSFRAAFSNSGILPRSRSFFRSILAREKTTFKSFSGKSECS